MRVFPSALLCISILLNCWNYSVGSKYDLEGDWVGKILTAVVEEQECYFPFNQELPIASGQIEWHFWLDGKQNLFTFVDLDTNETSSGNFTVDDSATPHFITFSHTQGKDAGLISYGIYRVDLGTVSTTYLAIATAGLPLRPVNFEPSQYVTVIQGNQLNTPMQVHLAFGPDPTSSMIVTWVTPAATKTSEVQYGLSSGHYSASATGAWTRYTYKNYTSPAIHKVNLIGLKAGLTYYYRVGDTASGYSKEFNFRMPQNTNQKVTVTIYGDMNLGGAIGGNTTVWKDSLDVLDLVLRQEQDTSDFLLHVGDVAYCNGTQHCWDRFFQDVQPIASHMPYMVCFGNHDVYPEPFGYTNRFTMPGPFSPTFQDGDYFYSFNLGPVHFVGFSTELWFLPVNATVNLTQQMDWLANDLKTANQPANRKVRPWVVAFGHRPIYCSVENYPDCQNGVALELQRQVEPLFIQNGVDIAVFGHIHSMERSYPLSYDATICGDYQNPCGTVHIVNGAAGQPFLGPPYPKPDWSAFRNHTHGYARMTATLSELQWDFVSKDTGDVIDTFTLGNPFEGTSKNWSPPIGAAHQSKKAKKILIDDVAQKQAKH